MELLHPDVTVDGECKRLRTLCVDQSKFIDAKVAENKRLSDKVARVEAVVDQMRSDVRALLADRAALVRASAIATLFDIQALDTALED